MRQAGRVLLSYMHMVNCLCHAALQSFLPHICTHNNVPSGQYPDVSILHICSSVQILYITFGFNSSFYNLVYRRSCGSVTGRNPLIERIPSDNLFPVVTISHTSAHVYSTGGLKVYTVSKVQSLVIPPDGARHLHGEDRPPSLRDWSSRRRPECRKILE